MVWSVHRESQEAPTVTELALVGSAFEGDEGSNPKRLLKTLQLGKEANMNEETFQRKLAELVAEIGTLPDSERGKLEMLAEQTRERHKQLKETVSSLQESIDFVRLSIKYMLFDLEATRRENEQLRKMLEDTERGEE